MTLDPSNLTGAALLSIVGGIIAGVIVVLIEWGFRALYGWNQRRVAIKSVATFFRDWENYINSTEDVTTSDGRFTLNRGVQQFARHKDRLRTVRIVLDRWSKLLSAEQTQDIALLIGGHEGAVVSLIPNNKTPSQNFYDTFFRDARKIKWLKF